MAVKKYPINFIISSIIELWGTADFLLQILKVFNLNKLNYVFKEATV